LFYIALHGKVNLSGLAAGLRVTPANVTGIIDRLEEQNLVVRTPDKQDRRIIWLGVTAEGESLVTSLREGRVSEMRRILERIPILSKTRSVETMVAAYSSAVAAMRESKYPPNLSNEGANA
jgi:DNA-binding MarR family transcriptional regulator